MEYQNKTQLTRLKEQLSLVCQEYMNKQTHSIKDIKVTFTTEGIVGGVEVNIREHK